MKERSEDLFKVLERKELAPTEFEILVDAPRIASKAQPGQFVILRIDENGERIPLTVVDTEKASGLGTLNLSSDRQIDSPARDRYGW